MKPHEIERHQAQPQQAEIVLHLDPSLFWFSGHFSVQPLLPGVSGPGVPAAFPPEPHRD